MQCWILIGFGERAISHPAPTPEHMQQSGDFKQGGWVPTGITPAVTVVHFLLLVNFRHAGGGRGLMQPWWRLPGGRHQRQKHSSFARQLIPQCGWAQEWAQACSCLRNSCAAVGRAKPREAGSRSPSFSSVTFQLCDLENVT